TEPCGASEKPRLVRPRVFLCLPRSDCTLLVGLWSNALARFRQFRRPRLRLRQSTDHAWSHTRRCNQRLCSHARSELASADHSLAYAGLPVVWLKGRRTSLHKRPAPLGVCHLALFFAKTN